MTKLEKEIAKYCKKFKITSDLEKDIASIKKMNLIFKRLKHDDDSDYVEIINAFKTFDNEFYIKEMKNVFLEIIDPQYHQSLLFLLDNHGKINTKEIVMGYLNE